MKKKMKKSVKGMTLIEVIIAMFVLGVMGLIMVRIATTSCRMMTAANHLNNKTEVEAPMAASHESTFAADLQADDVDLTISGGFTPISYTASRYGTSNWAALQGYSADTTSTVNNDLVYYTIN